MKTVFLSELSLSRRYSYQQIIIGLIVSVVLAIGMSNIYCIVPILVVSLTFSQAFTWVALDEQNGWERYRAALPLTRSNIMLGRMLAILARLFVVMIFGIILQIIMSCLAPVIANFVPIEFEDFAFDPPYISLTAGLSFLITAILIAFTIPFAARFGMTRAIRYIPLGFAALFILAVCFIGMMPGEEMVVRFESLLELGILWVNLWVIVAALVVFALGTLASVALYKKRQFS